MNQLSDKVKRLIETSGIYQTDRIKLHEDIMKAIEDSYSGDIMFIRKKLTDIEREELVQSIDSSNVNCFVPDII
jgi:hypothetical protein